MMKKPLWWWIATWFGSGLAPKASGTFGTIAALPFAFVIQYYGGNYYGGNCFLLIAAIAIFFVGWWASNQYMKHYPEKHDPKQIVVDEVAGMWLLLWLATPERVITAANLPTLVLYLACFALFRFFDVLKPYPISLADSKVKGGFGVMFDDILAAIYPMIIMFIIFIVAELSDINIGRLEAYLDVLFDNLSCDANYENCDP